MTCIQRIKCREIYEQISKERLQGGLNLINLKERIISTTKKLTFEAFEQKPETDNITYQLGTHSEKIINTKLTGPKTDKTNDKDKQIVDKLIKYQKKSPNI